MGATSNFVVENILMIESSTLEAASELPCKVTNGGWFRPYSQEVSYCKEKQMHLLLQVGAIDLSRG